MNWDPEQWRPLIADRSFLSWLVKIPTGTLTIFYKKSVDKKSEAKNWKKFSKEIAEAQNPGGKIVEAQERVEIRKKF